MKPKSTTARGARARKPARPRDIEKSYPRTQFVAKLRCLAEALEGGKAFTIRVAGETLRIPTGAIVNIEHERGKDSQELEFQLKWPTR